MESKKKKKKCSVEGCKNYVAPNNYFLCKSCYKKSEEEEFKFIYFNSKTKE